MKQYEHFRFSPSILQRLGEELTPNVDQGIVELVRNAYDADASTCRVELVGTDKPGGSVTISDDGDGMDADGIASGWLILGRSRKGNLDVTRGGRRPVGEKGLGRLAALRLGTRAALATRPRSEPGAQYRLDIDWQAYDAADTVESVPLEIIRGSSSKTPGTDLEISGLTKAIARRDVQRLARALLLLADPFQSSVGFKPELAGTVFRDLEQLVTESYFAQADYKLTASVGPDGQAEARVTNGAGRLLFRTHRLSEGPFRTGPATFELWNFLLDSKKFRSRSASSRELRDWLEVVGGVHLYHRKLRVSPYGDPGHDWLEMNLARVKSPEERASTNNSIGRVIVEDAANLLLQKTDRTGFIENEPFTELMRFAREALEWMTDERIKERERRRRATRVVRDRGVKRAKATLDLALKTVPSRPRKLVEQAVRRLERAHESVSTSLQQDVELYRTLATVGTTTAVFAHETAKPATQIEKMVDVVKRRALEAVGLTKFQQTLEKPIDLITRSARALRTYAGFPLGLLAHEKRQSSVFELHQAIQSIERLFEPFLTNAKVTTVEHFVDQPIRIRGTIANVDAILSNLIINAVNAFERRDAPSRRREISLRTEISGERVLLHVADSGPGISGIAIDDIWLPGRTTQPGGTGLGLTIVRDAAEDLGGEAATIQPGELGGAEFVIDLPRAEAT